jgi:hypothetical protein
MADANSTVWTFTQLGGSQRVLVLADHAAPHGRPRVRPVVEPSMEIREETTYYSGNNPPTRHLFGMSYGSFKLDGRFSDLYGGDGFARKKLDDVRTFVFGQQPCSIQWDDLVSVTGLIKNFKHGIESGGEITWEFEVLVDQDALLQPDTKELLGPRLYLDNVAELSQQLTDAQKQMAELQAVPKMRGSIFDLIGSLISSVNSATASLVNVAGQIDSLATAPFQLLRRFRDGLGQVMTAVSDLRNTYDNLTIDLTLESEADAEACQRFWDTQAGWGDSSLKAMQLALQAEQSAALAEQGAILALYTARDGDTWELISRRFYGGSATRAKDVRDANGLDAGANPIAGTIYFIPR